MDPSPLTRSWAQHRQVELHTSNQQNGHVDDHHTTVESKKLDAAVTTSPELEASALSVDESDHESDHETQLVRNESSEALAQRCSQLQEDVEVLASHLETQERAREQERKEAESERLALLQKNAALERELGGLRVERDALYRQSTHLAAQRAEDERQTNDVREAHDELLRALAQQQQQAELLQTAVSCAGRDRAEARKALDKAQMHCRRLEEELSAAHAQVLHLQNERDTLQAALDATVTGAAGYEARQLEAQDEVIASLRADLVQMEFELKTLSVDKSTLEEQVEKLELRLATSERSADYDVVPLGNNNTSDAVAKRKGQKKRTTIRPVRSSRDESSRRGSDLFNNLMELPNAVSQPPECASATIWLSPAASYFSPSPNISQNDQHHGHGRSFRERIAPPGLASFVAKTVQSARKHLATPLHNTFGSPQQ
ncbi:hypothetical protein PF005_g4725 [Phytophthora fragariae]|uniref:Uncharacterized protein n=1 Tax=Phytophthora fragariae TaxID=53985 RepID=A0A6A3FLQ4_9STRA|nr:hypothetical protein PF003_g228 [Phytophthora fragariae]KAE8945251.1 hypothetical protein PF009_g5075 [Phytophthora fragariae]KAE9024500.1 hypothetical protein PF011_g3461 [Phytophthora fragariae]KAE9129747.1 hypothetical protein PF007_g4763 [Phytophthora fragariae]KAE9129960.1 hypothetical protein PF010_g4000 [Phytophthora fragariae]